MNKEEAQEVMDAMLDSIPTGEGIDREKIGLMVGRKIAIALMGGKCNKGYSFNYKGHNVIVA